MQRSFQIGGWLLERGAALARQGQPHAVPPSLRQGVNALPGPEITCKHLFYNHKTHLMLVSNRCKMIFTSSVGPTAEGRSCVEKVSRDQIQARMIPLASTSTNHVKNRAAHLNFRSFPKVLSTF